MYLCISDLYLFTRVYIHFIYIYTHVAREQDTVQSITGVYFVCFPVCLIICPSLNPTVSWLQIVGSIKL